MRKLPLVIAAAILFKYACAASTFPADSKPASDERNPIEQLVEFSNTALRTGSTASDWTLAALGKTLANQLLAHCESIAESIVCSREANTAFRARLYSVYQNIPDQPLVVDFSLKDLVATSETATALANSPDWRVEPSTACTLRFRSRNTSGARQAVVQIPRESKEGVCLDQAKTVLISFVERNKIYPITK